MTKNQLVKKIISLLPSETLKEAIKTQKHSFTDLELVRFIDDFSKTYDQKINLLKEAEICFEDKSLVKKVRNRRLFYERDYEIFMKPSEDAVYETDIRLRPNGPQEETYVTKTFEDALLVIRSFLRYFRDTQKEPLDNPEARYTITKKTVRAPQKPHDVYDRIGDIGTCTLGYRLKILDVGIRNYDMAKSKNKFESKCRHKELDDCALCKDPCITAIRPKFPVFLDKYDLVAYEPSWTSYHIYCDGENHKINGNIQYGILLTDMNECADDTLVLLLDNPYIRERNAQYVDEEGRHLVYAIHDHPSYAELYKPDPALVPENVYGDYLYAVEEMKILEEQD